ncbi:MAG: GNAT family N-acetyltransferase [Opitutales bacterium]|nr:GNAT family N-acetyltransferase [Opitutales bacterium]
MKFDVQPADRSNLEKVSEVLIDAASWLESIGRPLWDVKKLNPGELKKEYDLGIYYLGTLEGEPVGVFRFQMKDEWVWPEFDHSEATYIHRLSVKRKFAGKGYSHLLIDVAISESKKRKRKFLRLDCDADRPELVEYYKKAGFKYHSFAQVGKFSAARFQMELARTRQLV